MAFIFSSDPGSLANQRLATDRTNIDLAQTERAAQQRAIDEYNQNQIAADRQAQEDYRQQQNQQFQFANLANSQAQQNKADATSAFRFNLGRQDDLTAAAEKKREFDVNTDLSKQQFQFTKAQGDMADAKNQLNDLVKMARDGTIPPDSDMGTLFPKLLPAQIEWAKQFSQQDKNAQAKEISDAAIQATRLVQGENPDKTVTHWFSPDTKLAAKPLDEKVAFGKLMVNKDLARYVPMLQWDVHQQQFVPVTSKPTPSNTPSWFTPSVAPAPLSAPPPAGGAAPLPPTNPGFNFATPQTNAPVAAPTNIFARAGMGTGPNAMTQQRPSQAVQPQVEALYQQAQDAINRGADRRAVQQRLTAKLAEMGYTGQ